MRQRWQIYWSQMLRMEELILLSKNNYRKRLSFQISLMGNGNEYFFDCLDESMEYILVP